MYTQSPATSSEAGVRDRDVPRGDNARIHQCRVLEERVTTRIRVVRASPRPNDEQVLVTVLEKVNVPDAMVVCCSLSRR